MLWMMWNTVCVGIFFVLKQKKAGNFGESREDESRSGLSGRYVTSEIETRVNSPPPPTPRERKRRGEGAGSFALVGFHKTHTHTHAVT